jgi:hypothetical protein
VIAATPRGRGRHAQRRTVLKAWPFADRAEAMGAAPVTRRRRPHRSRVAASTPRREARHPARPRRGVLQGLHNTTPGGGWCRLPLRQRGSLTPGVGAQARRSPSARARST